MEDYVSVLGARGSVPVSGPAFSRYGSATTSFLVSLDGRYVVIDAGTGLLALPAEAMEAPALPLLLTHAHADHLLGLPMCPYLMKPGARLDIYAAERSGLDAEAFVRRLFSPPLWPIGPERFPAEMRFHPLPETLSLDGVRVDAMEGAHPGGVSLLRLSGAGKRVVFASDCTLTEELLPRLADFARDCDLLLIDGQYSEDEWPAYSGYGHSTWAAAARLGRDCGAKRVRIIHHDPAHTDAALDAGAEETRKLHPGCGFAYEGEKIWL